MAKALSLQLQEAIDTEFPHLEAMTEEAASQNDGRPGSWTRKQELGHLIDSASNNHQRFVRASLQGALEFPGYDQDGCVRIEAPQEAPWALLVGLWTQYNLYLAHVIAHLPPSHLKTQCRIGADEPVSLQFLAEDYLTHLLHHLRQIDAAS